MGAEEVEPWVGKAGLARHLACGIRWVEERTREGMPSALIAGRRKYKISEAEAWLERSGHIKRDG